MFLRLVTDSFTRRPRRQLLTGAALALGMAVATAAISVALDVGDRLALEFRSLGANMVVTPEADSLPLEIGGVDYRSVDAAAYLPESELRKLKQIYWHNNIIAFAPLLETAADVSTFSSERHHGPTQKAQIIGTWASHSLILPDNSRFVTGVDKSNPWWTVQGQWFSDDGSYRCVVGRSLARQMGLQPGSLLIILQASGQDQDILLKSPNDPAALSLAALFHDQTQLIVSGILDSGGAEDNAVIVPLAIAQRLTGHPAQYRKLYVSALTKPEDDFARRDPKTMNAEEFERWSCSPYVSSIAFSIKQALPGTDVRVIHRVADGEGKILGHIQSILVLVTLVSLFAAALAVGASSAAGILERRTEIGLMKALGAGSATIGFLLAAEQLLLATVGGGIGYAVGVVLARIVGTRIFGVAPEPSLFVLVIILALAGAVTLLGSVLPLRRAARFEPAPILRGE